MRSRDWSTLFDNFTVLCLRHNPLHLESGWLFHQQITNSTRREVDWAQPHYFNEIYIIYFNFFSRPYNFFSKAFYHDFLLQHEVTGVHFYHKLF